jgi:sulfur carrier protein
VNGDALERPLPTSVASLLESLDLSGRVAVAVNRRVIVRSAHAETTLSDGDRVEILEAVGGG